jgi:hypothetical protein
MGHMGHGYMGTRVLHMTWAHDYLVVHAQRVAAAVPVQAHLFERDHALGSMLSSSSDTIVAVGCCCDVGGRLGPMLGFGGGGHGLVCVYCCPISTHNLICIGSV